MEDISLIDRTRIATILMFEQRIKEAFPDITPSGGHDYLDELMGLLRVTRMQRDSAERLLSERQRKETISAQEI
jgi:hypothetical protein